MPQLTPLFVVPAPTSDVPAESRVKADRDGGISLQALNKNGGEFNLYLVRRGSSQIWYKTAYGVKLTGQGAAAYVRVPASEVMIGEEYAVWTDRPSNVAFTDEAWVNPVGKPVNVAEYGY